MKAKQLIAGILAWALLLPALAAGRGDVPMAEDLRVLGKRAEAERIPILLVFTSPFCIYCDRAKEEYLGPMVDDPEYRDKVIIRQIEAGGDHALIGFDGRKTTHGAYAASQKIVMVPTIKVLDGQGRELADPIVGFLTPDFYFGYIQDAVNEGLEKMRGKAGVGK
ncbi:MAG: thioredoxin fold domain-containing protein [Pseudomonadota bacterium]